jgi:hypothetical protein
MYMKMKVQLARAISGFNLCIGDYVRAAKTIWKGVIICLVAIDILA